MPKRTALILTLLAAMVVGGVILVHLPDRCTPTEYRTVVIEGWTDSTRFGEAGDGAKETPNVARVLNKLRDEGWQLDRLLYVGQSILVVAAR